jgi:hypothetical protein
MTYYEAALQVLKAAERPLSTGEVTSRAIEKGLILPEGKTPNRTMGAVLYIRVATDPALVKLEEPGDGRAKRGSVRWALQVPGDLNDTE